MVNCLLLCLFAPNFLGLMCCWLQYAAKVGQGQFTKVGVGVRVMPRRGIKAAGRRAIDRPPPGLSIGWRQRIAHQKDDWATIKRF